MLGLKRMSMWKEKVKKLVLKTLINREMRCHRLIKWPEANALMQKVVLEE